MSRVLFATPRLRLRVPVRADVDAMFAYASDPEVTRFMDWPTHTRVETVAEFLAGALERWADGSEWSWVVTVPPADRAVGTISCRRRGHAIDFGYILARELWGRGLMTEAASAVVAWAGQLDGVHRVWATCDAENVGSARVLEKAGLAREGVLRCYAIKPNLGPLPRDAFIYSRVTLPA